VLLLLAGALAFFFLPLTLPLLSGPRELHAFVHVGFFALLGALVTGRLANRTPASTAWPMVLLPALSLALGLGGAIELVQPLVGRSASWGDLFDDGAGALLGAAWALRSDLPGRRMLLALATTAVGAALALPTASLVDRALALRTFPVLGDFESPLETLRWNRGVRTDEQARTGTHALRIELLPEPWSGATLERSFGDWSRARSFAFSVYVPPGDPPLRWVVTVRDRTGWARGDAASDRFDRVFVLGPGWNDLEISIEDIRRAPANRSLDLDDLASVVLFTPQPRAPRTVYLDAVELR
jgi:hypothetical protein